MPVTDTDVLAALLSMDVYNRTINQGVFVSKNNPTADAPETKIGKDLVAGRAALASEFGCGWVL